MLSSSRLITSPFIERRFISAALISFCQRSSGSLRLICRINFAIVNRLADDGHPSVLGRVPGFILQANYIEALLDQRYFEPAPWWLDYVLGFLIYASILLGLLSHKIFKTLICWLTTLIIAYLLIYVFIMQVGWYVNPVTVSGLALVVNASHLLFFELYQVLRGKP
jgi:hypothetical protein